MYFERIHYLENYIRLTLKTRENKRNNNKLILSKRQPQRGYKPHLINRETKMLSSNLYGLVDANSLKDTENLKFVRNIKMNSQLMKESGSKQRNLK